MKDSGGIGCKKCDKYKTETRFGKRKSALSGDWAQQLAEELHKPIRRKFTKRRVFAKGVDEIWAADLVEMQTFSEWNKGIKYLLMVIDVFSKFGWIEPLQNKKGETVASAFKKIFKSGRKPRLLWTDKGKEFYNKNVKQLLSRENIKLYSTEHKEKSSIIERWNRTIKEKMWKMFSANNTVYYDKIDDLLENYNNSFHRSVKLSPTEASKFKNSKRVFGNLYPDEIYKRIKTPKFHIGDRVRISKFKRKLFDEGFTPNWTEEIFVIDGKLNTKPVTYRLVDLQGEAVTGSFYEQELQRSSQEIFRIEKVILRDNKRKFALVKWRGYPDKFN